MGTYKGIQGTVSDIGLSTTYLKLEPIKQELSITTSFDLSGGENDTIDADGNTLTDKWILTSGNTSFTGLSSGVIIQFCSYNPETKIAEELFHTTFDVTSTSVIEKEITLADELWADMKEFRRNFQSLQGKLKTARRNDLVYDFVEEISPYLKVYVLPANYVTKQIQIGTIQGYWQDPTFSNVMWIQHTSCCSFTSGPFSPTVTGGEGDDPATITQTALASKAATGTEVFHNIIPLLDKIMTYAN